MGKGSKLLGLVFLVLGIACIGMYFVFPNEEKNEFKVVFDSNGGTAVSEQIVKKGEKVNKPDDPTKDGSEFVEWQLDGLTYVFDNAVMKDMTLIAKWDDIKTFNVKVTIDGSEYTADIKEGGFVTFEALNIPTKEGYNIKYYNENNEEFDTTQPITSDLVLTAKYVEIKTFTVKFDSNGGSKVNEVKVAEGTPIEEPTTTRDGYTLDGWYIGNEKFDFTTPITKAITLKAKWTENGKINVYFKVDDKVDKTVAVKEGTTVSKYTPTKKGYKFIEWQNEDGTKFDFNTKITAETTLIASFEEAKTVTVTFDSDGGSKVETKVIETGSKLTAPTAPTKEGYKFGEWQLNGKKYNFGSAVNEDIKLKATWIKVYTVTFKDDKTELSSQEVEKDGKATKPKDPTKEGYKFVEWLLDNNTYNFNTPVTKDITLVARYEKVITPTATPAPNITPSPEPDVNSGDVDEAAPAADKK